MLHLTYAGITIAALLSVVAHAAPKNLVDAETDVTDRYIITLKPDVDMTQHLNWIQQFHSEALSTRQDGKAFEGLSYNYSIASFQAYAGHFDNSVIQHLQAHKDVEAIEADQIMAINGLTTQVDAPYNLNLISHLKKDKPKDGYAYDSSAGVGTRGYVIDTGIDISHPEFGGRASWGHNIFHTKNEDTIGHGTEVAGIIGGTTYGVAKKCSLIAVKVFSRETGPAANILEGFNWAWRDIVSRKMQSSSVINISVSGSRSRALQQAIDEAFQAGVLTVLAAGQDNVDSRTVWSAKEAIVVGYTDKNRKRVSDSNWGRGITMFAPGVSIKTASLGKKIATVYGTSFAAPHVTGLALYVQALGRSSLSAAATKRMLIQRALVNVVGDPKGSPNQFAYNGSGK